MNQLIPQDVQPIDLAFGGNMDLLLPPYKMIPPEFKSQSNLWVKWQSEWFFNGLKSLPEAKDGIDQNTAIRHLAAIQSSFQPSHEHKQAGVAYLASLWLVQP